MSAAIITVDIRSIAFGGEGVGVVCAQEGGTDELLGITAFIAFSAPGEKVRARITEQKKRHVRAELLEVLSPSPKRVEPVCEHFTVCGGCELQHLSYTEQLEAKRVMIEGALRAAKLESDVINRLEPIEPCLDYGYRHRVTLHIDTAGRVGFYRSGSRSVVAVSSCPVAVPAINEALDVIQDFGREVPGKLSSILLEADDKGLVVVLKSPYDLGDTERREVMSKAREYFQNVVLLAGEKEVDGTGRQILNFPLNDVGSMKLEFPAGSFSQVNWKANRWLIQSVVENIGIARGSRVFDLYSGAGNFALPMARAGADVTAVECDKRLVMFGRQNAAKLGYEKQLKYVESSVEKFIAGHNPKTKVDAVVADPPRNGLGQLVGSFGFAERLLLVSCHLPSFVRDVKGLLDNGFSLEFIQPFDMFAQTSYTEILSVFRQ